MKVTAFEVFVAIRLRFSADVISLFCVCVRQNAKLLRASDALHNIIKLMRAL